MTTGWSPAIVPYGADQTVYVVIDRRGLRDYAVRNVEYGDLDTAIADLLLGQFDDPIRVVAFNTLEHWSRDLSADVAHELQARCDIEAAPMPEHLNDFVSRSMQRKRLLA